MLPTLRYTLLIFILYPLLGFITISYFGFPPFYVHSLMIVFMFVQFIGVHNSPIRFPKYLQFFLLYLVLLIVSVYVVHKQPLKFDAKLALVVFKINPILILLVIENVKISNKFIKDSKKLMLIIVIVAAIVSIIQYFNPTFFLFSEKYTGADDSIIGYKQRIGSIFTWGDLMNIQYLAIGFSIMYGILLVEYKSNKKISMLLTILVGVVVFLSQFRIAMVTYIIVSIFFMYRKVSFRSILIVAIVLLVFYSIARFLSFDLRYVYENRIKSETALTRIDAFSAFVAAFPENPLFGTGGVKTAALYKGFGHVARMHNAHLNIAYYYGIFVSIAHTLFLVYLIRVTYLTGRRANYWVPLIGVICLLSVMMTEHTVEFYEPGFIIMMVYNKYYYDRYINYIDISTIKK
jgi:hypothetical protein